MNKSKVFMRKSNWINLYRLLITKIAYKYANAKLPKKFIWLSNRQISVRRHFYDISRQWMVHICFAEDIGDRIENGIKCIRILLKKNNKQRINQKSFAFGRVICFQQLSLTETETFKRLLRTHLFSRLLLILFFL